MTIPSEYPEFAPFSLFAFLSGTLIYACREFYIILTKVVKYADGRTGYMNYGLWTAGNATVNPSGELVKAVLTNLDPSTIPQLDSEGAAVLEIGCGLGQPAVDASFYFGPKASITGVSINAGHVARANNLAKANSLSSRVQHHTVNATDVHTLPQKPFGAAYSVEVLSEIPDPHLERALCSIHQVLIDGAEFAFADIIRTEGKSRTAIHAGTSKWSHYTRSLATKTVTQLWGDDWRTLSTMETLLAKSGFEILSVESIGDRVFVPTWVYAKQRIVESPSLGMDYETVGAWCWLLAFGARWLTRGSLQGLAMLFDAGEIDYIIVKARKI